jgi:hypothetical protein
LNGTGDLTLSIAGQSATAKGVAFAGIKVDARGNVQYDATGYRFSRPIQFAIPSAGSEVTISDAVLLVSDPSSTGTTPSVSLTGPMAVDLPVKDDAGRPLELVTGGGAPPQFGFKFSGSGGSLFLSAPELQLSPKAPRDVHVAGFRIPLRDLKLLTNNGGRIAAPDLKFGIQIDSGAPRKLDLHVPEAALLAPLPGLTTGAEAGNLALLADGIDIDETGAPTIQKLRLASASREATMTIGAPHQTLALAELPGFYLAITDLAGSVKAGRWGPGGVLKGTVVLPASVAPPNSGLPFQVAVDTSGQFELALTYSGAQSGAPIRIGTTMTGRITHANFDPRTGLSDVAATLTLSNVDLPTLGGQGITVATNNAVLDAQGLTGDFAMQGGSVGGSVGGLGGLTIQDLGVTLDRSALAGGSAEGTLAFGAGSNRVTLGLAIGISKAGGVTYTVLPPKDPVSIGGGWLQLDVAGGCGSVDPKGHVTFHVAGSARTKLTDLDATFQFDDLGIDENGKLNGDIALEKPVSVGIGPLSVHAQDMSLNLATSPPTITLTGGVDFPKDLPVCGNVDFQGLTVGPSGVTINGLSIEASVEDMCTLDVSFDSRSNKKGNSGGGFGQYLTGSGGITLDAIPGSPNFDCGFLLAQDAWAGYINAVMPPPGIPIIVAPTPPPVPIVFLDGFFGAVGHHVAYAGNASHSDPKKVLASYSNPKASPADIFKYDSGVEAYVDIGGYLTTADEFTLWGPIGVRVQAGKDFAIVLHADSLGLMWPRTTNAQQIADHHASLDIGYWNHAVQVEGDAVWNVTVGGSQLFGMSGGIQAYFGQDKGYLYVGWPLDSNGLTESANFFGILQAQSKEGFGIDFYPSQGVHTGFSESGQVNIANVLSGGGNVGFTLGLTYHSGELSGSFDGQIGANVSICGIGAYAQGDLNGSLSLPSLHGSLRADMSAGVSLPFVGNVGFDTGTVTMFSN